MEEAKVETSSNWVRSGGSSLTQAIQTRVSHEDYFVKPELEELLSEDRAVLLTSSVSAAESAPCELTLRLFPRYKIESLSLVCSAPKVELFIGRLKEYTETIYGAIIADDDVENDGTPLLSYRYDIEVQKSGICELMLKLLTASHEICIYGMLLQIAPNPNGITTLAPPTINLDNVQQMLSGAGQKLSPGAEKCKMFLEMCNRNSAAKTASASTAAAGTDASATPMTLLEQMKQVLITKQQPHQSIEGAGAQANLPLTLDVILKSHVDVRLQELEMRLNARLDAIVAQQATKLDKILRLLEQDK